MVILLTLLVQGLTLPYIISKGRAFQDFMNEEEEELTRLKIKHELKQHVYQFLKTKHENELQGHAGVERMLKHWEEKTKANDDGWMNEKNKIIFVEMLEVQRQYLSELNKDVTINEDVIRQQLYQIDLEEERLKMI